MSGWMGQRGLSQEDIKELHPSLVRFAPTLARYFVDDQKLHVTVILPHDEAEEFREAVTRAYGSFRATTVGKAASEALSQWIKAHR